MKTAEKHLRTFIKNVLSEAWNDKNHPDNPFSRAKDSLEKRIHWMHDTYDLKKTNRHKFIDMNNSEEQILMHTNPDDAHSLALHGKFGSLRRFPDRLVSIFVKYNARVYYDNSLSDEQKLNLMIDSFDANGNELGDAYEALRSHTEGVKKVNCDGQKDTYQLSEDGKGLDFILCYPYKKLKVIVSIKLDHKPGVLRRLVNFLESEGIENVHGHDDLSVDKVKSRFASMDIEKLKVECDLPKGALRRNSFSSSLKEGSIIECDKAIPKDEPHYKAKEEKGYYLVLGFDKEEFEDLSAGSSYGRASTYRKDSGVFEVVYMSDLKGEIYYLVLDEGSEDNYSVI